MRVLLTLVTIAGAGTTISVAHGLMGIDLTLPQIIVNDLVVGA